MKDRNGKEILVQVLIDYMSGRRKVVDFYTDNADELCKEFKKHHNIKLIDDASIYYMRKADDKLAQKFNKFIDEVLSPKYEHFAYYNGSDAVDMMNETADDIVANMLNGVGAVYHPTKPFYKDTAEFFMVNYDGQLTTDEEYIVVYDVANHWNGKDISKVDENELMDEYIDIYKKVHK